MGIKCTPILFQKFFILNIYTLKLYEIFDCAWLRKY